MDLRAVVLEVVVVTRKDAFSSKVLELNTKICMCTAQNIRLVCMHVCRCFDPVGSVTGRVPSLERAHSNILKVYSLEIWHNPKSMRNTSLSCHR